MMAVTQGLCNSGIEVLCDYAAYSVLMLEKLTKLSLWFPSTPVLYAMPFAATLGIPAKENDFSSIK